MLACVCSREKPSLFFSIYVYVMVKSILICLQLSFLSDALCSILSPDGILLLYEWRITL